MPTAQQLRDSYKEFLKRNVSREEVQKAMAKVAQLKADPIAWEATLDFIEQDFYGMVVEKVDPEMVPFECLTLEMKEAFVRTYGDQSLEATPEAFLFACREIAGGKEAHDALVSQFELEQRRAEQDAFNFFDMFSQGRSLGKLPKPEYVLAVATVIIERGNAGLKWLQDPRAA